MQILYFAWLKTRIGCSQEQVTPPQTVKTVADLARWLATKSPGHAAALGDMTTVKAAVDQTYVPAEHLLGEAREVAFFPPVTGG